MLKTIIKGFLTYPADKLSFFNVVPVDFTLLKYFKINVSILRLIMKAPCGLVGKALVPVAQRLVNFN